MLGDAQGDVGNIFVLAKEEVHKKRKHITNETPLSAVVISMTFSMIYFLYLTICRTALEIFNCKDTDPATGRYYMVSQPLEGCYVENMLQTRLTPYALGVLCGTA